MIHSSIRRVVGLVGEKAVGKGIFCRHAEEKFGFTTFTVSDVIREAWSERGEFSPSTTMLQDLGDEMKLKSGEGGYWIDILCRRAEERETSLVLIDGIRNPAEVRWLAKKYGGKFLLVGLRGPKPFRLKWYLARKKKGDVLTPEAFEEMDARDQGVGQMEHGQQVAKTLALVPSVFTYDNVGSLEDFFAWEDKALQFALEGLPVTE